MTVVINRSEKAVLYTRRIMKLCMLESINTHFVVQSVGGAWNEDAAKACHLKGMSFGCVSQMYFSQFLFCGVTCANVFVSRCHHRITAALGSVRKVLTVTPTVRRYSTHMPCFQYGVQEIYSTHLRCHGSCVNQLSNHLDITSHMCPRTRR